MRGRAWLAVIATLTFAGCGSSGGSGAGSASNEPNTRNTASTKGHHLALGLVLEQSWPTGKQLIQSRRQAAQRVRASETS